MDLLDILACPRCRADLQPAGATLACRGCAAVFPIEDGVPILLPDPGAAEVVHEDDLDERTGFEGVLDQVLGALPADHVVLDIGSGNRDVADERIVRMDVVRSPFVDVVADAHALPLKDGVVHFLHSSSVFEHLRRPWDAANEMTRVLRPGGNLFVDCAFVFPFHGYPATYFNASTDGLRELFRDLDEAAVGVAPWTMPSFAVERLLVEYLRFFQPQTEQEHAFVAAIRDLERFPMRDFDARFTQEDAARIAACVFFGGLQPDPELTSLPPGLRARYRSDAELAARYPKPIDLLTSLVAGAPDNVYLWARGAEPELLGGVEPFSRRLPGQ